MFASAYGPAVNGHCRMNSFEVATNTPNKSNITLVTQGSSMHDWEKASEEGCSGQCSSGIPRVLPSMWMSL